MNLEHTILFCSTKASNNAKPSGAEAACAARGTADFERPARRQQRAR